MEILSDSDEELLPPGSAGQAVAASQQQQQEQSIAAACPPPAAPVAVSAACPQQATSACPMPMSLDVLDDSDDEPVSKAVAAAGAAAASADTQAVRPAESPRVQRTTAVKLAETPRAQAAKPAETPRAQGATAAFGRRRVASVKTGQPPATSPPPPPVASPSQSRPVVQPTAQCQAPTQQTPQRQARAAFGGRSRTEQAKGEHSNKAEIQQKPAVDMHRSIAELDKQKANLATKPVAPEIKEQQPAGLHAKLNTLEAVSAKEIQRASTAEAFTKDLRGEIERLRLGHAEAAQQSEQALSAAEAEKHALKNELEQAKKDSTNWSAAARGEQQKTLSMQEEKCVLQKEVEHLKTKLQADLAANTAVAEAEKLQLAALRADLEQMEKAKSSEQQRAARAEALAQDRQQEIERMQSGETEALQKAEQALSAASAEKQALQNDLEQIKNNLSSRAAAAEAEQEKIVSMTEELDRLRDARAQESVRAATAEKAVAERQQEIEQLYAKKSADFQKVQEQLCVSDGQKHALQVELEQMKAEFASSASKLEGQQKLALEEDQCFQAKLSQLKSDLATSASAAESERELSAALRSELEQWRGANGEEAQRAARAEALAKAHHEEIERLRSSGMDAVQHAEEALSVARADQQSLKEEIKAEQQQAASMKGDIDRLMVAHDAAAKRASVAETAAAEHQLETERVRVNSLESLQQANEQFTASKEERAALETRLEKLQREMSSNAKLSEVQQKTTWELQEKLQAEISLLKADLVSKAEAADAEQQQWAGLRTELEQLQTASGEEMQRAARAEALARERQDEVERLQSGMTVSVQEAEQALSAARSKKRDLQEEIRTEHQTITSIRDELESFRASCATESRRASAAEACAAEQQQESERVRAKDSLALQQLNEQLVASKSQSLALRTQVEQLQTEFAGNAGRAEAEQEQTVKMKETLQAELARLEADLATEAAAAARTLLQSVEVQSELEQAHAANAEERQRASMAESAVKDCRDEIDRLQSCRAEAVERREQALSVANADQRTLHEELQFERQKAASIMKDLDDLKVVHVRECKRASDAEAVAAEHERETARVQAKGTSTLQEVHEKLARSQEATAALQEELALVKAELADTVNQAMDGQNEARDMKAVMQGEIEQLKADLTSKSAEAQNDKQQAAVLQAEVEQLQAVSAGEVQRAAQIEAAAKDWQEEVQRLQAARTEAVEQAERVSSTAKAERQALQEELDQVKGDLFARSASAETEEQKAACMLEELDRLKLVHDAECKRASLAAGVAAEQRQVIDRLRTEGSETLLELQEQLIASNRKFDASQQEHEALRAQCASNGDEIEFQQKRALEVSEAMQTHISCLEAEIATEISAANAERRRSASLQDNLEELQATNAAETQGSERAEALAKGQQEEIERLQLGQAEADQEAERALSAANAHILSLKEELEVANRDLSSRSALAETEQQRFSLMQDELECVKAAHDAQSARASAAEALAATRQHDIESGRDDSSQALLQVQEQLAAAQQDKCLLLNELEQLKAALSSSCDNATFQQKQVLEMEATLQADRQVLQEKLEQAKSELSSNLAVSADHQRKTETIWQDLECLRAVHATESQHASAAEAKSAEQQQAIESMTANEAALLEELEQLKTEMISSAQSTEVYETQASEMKSTLEAELAQLKVEAGGEQRQSTELRAELQQLESENAVETARAAKAEALAKDRLTKIERLRSGRADAIKQAEEALSAANADNESLRKDLAIQVTAVENEQQNSVSLQHELESMKAVQATESQTALAAEAMAAKCQRETELVRTEGLGALHQVQEQLHVYKEAERSSKARLEQLASELASSSERSNLEQKEAVEMKEIFGSELLQLKADLAAKVAAVETGRKEESRLGAELEQLQADSASEMRRAAEAEAMAEGEVERLRSVASESAHHAEQALLAAMADKQALQQELDGVRQDLSSKSVCEETEQEKAACMQEQLEALKVVEVAESNRVLVAEEAAAEHQQVAKRLHAEHSEASRQAQEQLAARRKESENLKLEMEQLASELSNSAEESAVQHKQASEWSMILQAELAQLKLDLAGKAALADAEHQQIATLQAELEQSQAAQDSEKQRAASAEEAVQEQQEEVKRLQSSASVAVRQAEQALSAANADKEALQKEMDHVKQDLMSRSATAEAEQQKITSILEELELMKATEVAESSRADAAEAMVAKHRQQAELLHEADLEAMRQVKEQLTTSKGLKDTLQDQLEQLRTELSSNTEQFEARQKHSSHANEALKGELAEFKSDLAARITAAETEHKQLAELGGELEKLRTAHEAEMHRAARAEALAKDRQTKVERLRSSRADAVQQAEQALSAANADKVALQEELERIKHDLFGRSAAVEAEQQKAACMQEELATLVAGKTAESKSAFAAEALAAKYNADKRALQKELEVVMKDLSITSATAKAEQQRAARMHQELQSLEVTQVTESKRAVVAEEAAAEHQQAAEQVRAESSEALRRAQEQLATGRKEHDALEAHMEKLAAKFACDAEETGVQHKRLLEVNETLQAELAELKVDLDTNTLVLERDHQQSASLKTELEQSHVARDSEKQRTARAEEAARRQQEEHERLQSGARDALQQAEQTVAALSADKKALQDKLDHVRQDLCSRSARAEAEQEETACLRKELDALREAQDIESKRASAAKEDAAAQQREIRWMRAEGLEAVQRAQQQASTSMEIKDALQETLEQVRAESTSAAEQAEVQQKETSKMNEALQAELVRLQMDRAATATIISSEHQQSAELRAELEQLRAAKVTAVQRANHVEALAKDSQYDVERLRSSATKAIEQVERALSAAYTDKKALQEALAHIKLDIVSRSVAEEVVEQNAVGTQDRINNPRVVSTTDFKSAPAAEEPFDVDEQESMHLKGSVALRIAQEQRSASTMLQEEMEQLRADSASKSEELEVQQREAVWMKNTLRSELAELKADLATKATMAESEEQQSAGLRAELKQLQELNIKEMEQVAMAEALAKNKQHEVERMRLSKAEVVQQTEEALAAANCDKQALKIELGHTNHMLSCRSAAVEAELQNAVCMPQELESLKTTQITKSKRTSAAEATADEKQREATQMHAEGLEALEHTQRQLAVSNVGRDALHQMLEQLKVDFADKINEAELQRKQALTAKDSLKDEIHQLKAVISSEAAAAENGQQQPARSFDKTTIDKQGLRSPTTSGFSLTQELERSVEAADAAVRPSAPSARILLGVRHASSSRLRSTAGRSFSLQQEVQDRRPQRRTITQRVDADEVAKEDNSRETASAKDYVEANPEGIEKAKAIAKASAADAARAREVARMAEASARASTEELEQAKASAAANAAEAARAREAAMAAEAARDALAKRVSEAMDAAIATKMDLSAAVAKTEESASASEALRHAESTEAAFAREASEDAIAARAAEAAQAKMAVEETRQASNLRSELQAVEHALQAARSEQGQILGMVPSFVLEKELAACRTEALATQASVAAELHAARARAELAERALWASENRAAAAELLSTKGLCQHASGRRRSVLATGGRTDKEAAATMPATEHGLDAAARALRAAAAAQAASEAAARTATEVRSSLIQQAAASEALLAQAEARAEELAKPEKERPPVASSIWAMAAEARARGLNGQAFTATSFADRSRTEVAEARLQARCLLGAAEARANAADRALLAAQVESERRLADALDAARACRAAALEEISRRSRGLAAAEREAEEAAETVEEAEAMRAEADKASSAEHQVRPSMLANSMGGRASEPGSDAKRPRLSLALQQAVVPEQAPVLATQRLGEEPKVSFTEQTLVLATARLGDDPEVSVTELFAKAREQRELVDQVNQTREVLARRREAASLEAELAHHRRESQELSQHLARLRADCREQSPRRVAGELRAALGAWQARRKRYEAVMKGLRGFASPDLADRAGVTTDESCDLAPPGEPALLACGLLLPPEVSQAVGL
eukprot:TRINITY_DN22603_c0_g2_i1.p1 TRINITY_DN22603_c0_g2~~TRINITY_DN22603_c0_g2_i1.p1  ORF type:complete len:3980 (-),score=1334.10 TRINITY_DN22603_c0_g2_i1:43-11928(-)